MYNIIYFSFLQKQENLSPEKSNFIDDELRPPGDCDEDSLSEK